VTADDVSKQRAWIRQQQPGTAAGAALPHAIRFNDDRPEPRHRARIRRGAAGETAANDDHVAGVLAAKTGEIRSTGAGELKDPRRLAVTGGHQINAKCKMRNANGNGRESALIRTI
jgi:hypothetical protein